MNVSYNNANYKVSGVLAEIFSVLTSDPATQTLVFGDIELKTVLAALDTTIPAEERVSNALSIIKMLINNSIIGGWIPFYSELPSLEYKHYFASEHYSAYRDHTVHSLCLYLFGWYIFIKCGKIREPLIKGLRSRAYSSSSLSDLHIFKEWWTVTAIWHDWGYPFESAGIINDAVIRNKIYSNLNEALGKKPFIQAIQRLKGTQLSDRETRAIYAAGRYYPWEVTGIIDFLNNKLVTKIIDELWNRIGFSRKELRPCDVINYLTVQIPQGRPSYYDHGQMGAIMLSSWWNEAQTFILELGEKKINLSDSIFPETKREEAGNEYLEMSCIVDCAIEAIAFHNILLRDWPEDELNNLGIDIKSIIYPSSTIEPHLFFLALCDSLQNWDRHHFNPIHEGQYKPTIRSYDILIQATNDNIAFLPADNDLSEIKKLFNEWLDAGDIERIFINGATYSLPDKLHADTVKLSEVKQLDEMYTTIINIVVKATKEVRQILSNNEDAINIHQTIAILEDTMSRVKKLMNQLLPTSKEILENTNEWQNYIDYQGIVTSMIRIGRTVSRGEIVDKLGEGGFGIVYLVQLPEKPVTEYVAYKIYHQIDLRNIEKRRLFERGFLAMQRLWACKNIVPVYEYTEFPVGFYMKFIKGENLEENLGRAGDIHKRLEIMSEIANVIDYAHKNNVLHRDIKPSNVILDENNVPMLTDFDLAWFPGRSTNTKVTFASMYYGAPEQYEERMAVYRVKKTVDIYGFGALLYFIITGVQPPIMASFKEEHWEKIRHSLSEQLYQKAIDSIVLLIQSCTKYHPDERIDSMSKISRQLQGILSLGWDSEIILPKDDFLRELEVRVGKIEKGYIVSKTGQSGWLVDLITTGYHKPVDIKLECNSLFNTTPGKPGMDYEKLKKIIARQIDDCIDKWANSGNWVGDKPRRTRYENNRCTINISNVITNQRNARLLASFLSEISRIIE